MSNKKPKFEEEFIEEEVQEEVVEETEAVEEDSILDNGDGEFLFPNGPTMNQVEEWKSRYKEIFLTEFDDDLVFIWRTLNRKEYKDIIKIQNADNLYREERICERCVVWPENYSYMSMSSGRAGIPSLLAEQVMDKSGFVAKTGALKL